MVTKNIPIENTKTRIIRAATKLFADKGYQQTTIAEIAGKAGMAEGSLYEHFQGKEDLLHTIPDLWVKQAINELEYQLFGIKGAFNKLRKFLWWYIRYIEEYPLTAAVVYLQLKTNANFMKTDVYKNVQTFFNSLTHIFEEGRESGEMKADINVFSARGIFLGAIEHMVIRWLLKGRSYSLFENLEGTFRMLQDAFKADDAIREK